MGKLRKGAFWLFIALVALVILLPGGDESEDSSSVQRPQANNENTDSEEQTSVQTEQPQAEPVNYEVAQVKDISTDLPGEGQEDTLGEQENLTMAKRYRYMIVLPPLRNEQVRPTLEQVVDEAIAERPDMDGIAMLLYSSEDIVDVGPDIGQATWAPDGDFANITARIARTNDRSKYKLAIDIDHDDLKAYMEQRTQSEERFGLSEDKRRQIYKELICAEQAADAEAQKLYPTSMDDPDYESSSFDRQYQLMDRLMPQYVALVRERHDITEEEEDKISSEGFEENWPWPSPPLEDIWDPDRGHYPIPSECPEFPPPDEVLSDR